MHTTEAARRQRRQAGFAFAALTVPGLGVATLAAWVLSRSGRSCWPPTRAGFGCGFFLGARSLSR